MTEHHQARQDLITPLQQPLLHMCHAAKLVGMSTEQCCALTALQATCALTEVCTKSDRIRSSS